MKRLFILICAVFISGCVSHAIENKILEQAQVVRIIDGDTLEIATGQKVRLLHVNAPEQEEHCYEEAKQRLSELVANKTVLLEQDVQNKDKYNRLLRYVYLNDSKRSVNQQLIEEGLAVVYIVQPNLKYKEAFLASEKKAIKNRIGCLWKNQSQWQGCFEVLELRTCKEGDYVILKNNCKTINVENWTLRDQSRARYRLKGSVEANKTIIIKNGWKNARGCVWDNSDTLYLFDFENKLVLRYHY